MKQAQQAVILGTALVAAGIGAAFAGAPSGLGNPNPHATGTVFVTSQMLTYNTFVPVMELPPVGPFQLLVQTPTGAFTEFGPGDRGYLGGRWWVDVNGNGERDPDIDDFFLCPLLPPGY
jgi:hypothetical protein